MLYAFVVLAELCRLGIKKLFIFIKLLKTHLYQYKRHYIRLQFSLLCNAQATVLQGPTGHRRVGNRSKGGIGTLQSSVYEKSKEKMCFSQHQEEKKLEGNWSCVFANGEN